MAKGKQKKAPAGTKPGPKQDASSTRPVLAMAVAVAAAVSVYSFQPAGKASNQHALDAWELTDRANKQDALWLNISKLGLGQERHETFPTNNYGGYTVPRAAFQCERVGSDISQEDFHSKYVAQRKPVIIENPTNGSSFAHLGWNTDEWINKQYLEDIGGDIMVEAESVSIKDKGSTKIGANEKEAVGSRGGVVGDTVRFGASYVDITFKKFLVRLKLLR
jgi:hypothetical protein